MWMYKNFEDFQKYQRKHNLTHLRELNTSAIVSKMVSLNIACTLNWYKHWKSEQMYWSDVILLKQWHFSLPMV